MYPCPPAGSKLARPLVIAGTVAAGAAAYGNRDKHAAGPLAVAAAVNGAAIALTLFLLKPLEAEIEVRGMGQDGSAWINAIRVPCMDQLEASLINNVSCMGSPCSCSC